MLLIRVRHSDALRGVELCESTLDIDLEWGVKAHVPQFYSFPNYHLSVLSTL